MCRACWGAVIVCVSTVFSTPTLAGVGGVLGGCWASQWRLGGQRGIRASLWYLNLCCCYQFLRPCCLWSYLWCLSFRLWVLCVSMDRFRSCILTFIFQFSFHVSTRVILVTVFSSARVMLSRLTRLSGLFKWFVRVRVSLFHLHILFMACCSITPAQCRGFCSCVI